MKVSLRACSWLRAISCLIKLLTTTRTHSFGTVQALPLSTSHKRRPGIIYLTIVAYSTTQEWKSAVKRANFVAYMKY